MEQLLFRIRPEFLETVSDELAQKSVSRSRQHVPPIGFAIRTPGIRKRIAARDCEISGVCGVGVPFPVRGHERELCRMTDAPLNG